MGFIIHKAVKTLFINDTELPVQDCETVTRDFGNGESERFFFYVNLVKLRSDYPFTSSQLEKLISKIKVCSIRFGDSTESRQFKQINVSFHHRDQAIFEHVDDSTPSENHSEDTL